MYRAGDQPLRRTGRGRPEQGAQADEGEGLATGNKQRFLQAQVAEYLRVCRIRGSWPQGILAVAGPERPGRGARADFQARVDGNLKRPGAEDSRSRLAQDHGGGGESGDDRPGNGTKGAQGVSNRTGLRFTGVSTHRTEGKIHQVRGGFKVNSDGSGSEWTSKCQDEYLEQRRRIKEAQRSGGTERTT